MMRGRWWILGGLAGGFVVFALTMSWPADLIGSPLVVNEALKPADVIIVLGAGTRRGSDPLPTQAKLRTEKGIELWRAKLAPTVMISGGKSKITGLIESNIMTGYAIERGLPRESIIPEENSTSTRENAEQSLKIMKEKNMDTAIVVTSTYHTWRSCRVFRRLHNGIQCAAATVHASPENFYDRLVNLRAVFREYGAIVLYALRGYL